MPLNTVLNHGEGKKLKGRQFQKGEREWGGGWSRAGERPISGK